MKKSGPRPRVIPKFDIEALARSLSFPGIDPRVHFRLGVVKEITADAEEGIFIDVRIMPTGELAHCRYATIYSGPGFGLYSPIEVDDEVGVFFPGGDFDEGGIVLPRMHSPADYPSADFLDETDPEQPTRDFVLHVKQGSSFKVIVDGSAAKFVVEARNGAKIYLGDKDLSEALDGLVHGRGIDTFTGQTFTALGATSSVVLGKK